MDYNWYDDYDSGDSIDFKKKAPPTGTPYNDIIANKIHYGSAFENRFYRIPTVVSSGRSVPLGDSNVNNRISFAKWQWSILQKDDEVVKQDLVLTSPIKIFPKGVIKNHLPGKIIATTMNFAKNEK